MASSFRSVILNYQLEGVREEFSQYLQEMRSGLIEISKIITYCTIYWENRIVEIEEIIKKLKRGEQRMNKLITKSILTKAKNTLTDSKGYSVAVRQTLDRDLILGVSNL